MHPLSLSPFTFDFSTIDWKVLLGAAAFIVGLITLVYFQWWRNRKRLSYEVLSNVVLLSAEEEIQDKVEIRYEGQPVKNVRLIVIKLINDGYVPIKKDDFEKVVRFVFPDAKILTSEKVKFQPENLATQMAYRDDWVEMDPALFNRKDYVQFKVLLSNYSKMKIDARIVGVSSITRSRKRMSTPEYVLMFSGLIGFAILSLQKTLPDTAFLFAASTLLILTFIALIVSGRSRQH